MSNNLVIGATIGVVGGFLLHRQMVRSRIKSYGDKMYPQYSGNTNVVPNQKVNTFVDYEYFNSFGDLQQSFSEKLDDVLGWL